MPWNLGSPSFDHTTPTRQQVTNIDGEAIAGIEGTLEFPMPPRVDVTPVLDRYHRPKLFAPGDTGSKPKAQKLARTLVSGIDISSDYALARWNDRQLMKGLLRNPILLQGQGLSSDYIGTEMETVLDKPLEHLADQARQSVGSYDSRAAADAVIAWVKAYFHRAETDTPPLQIQGWAEAIIEAVDAAAHGEILTPANANFLDHWLYTPGVDPSGKGVISTPQLIVGDSDNATLVEIVTSKHGLKYSGEQVAMRLAVAGNATHMLADDQGEQWVNAPAFNATALIVYAPVNLDETPKVDTQQLDLTPAIEAFRAGIAYQAALKNISF